VEPLIVARDFLPHRGHCPHVGNGGSGQRSIHSENDEDPVPGDTLKISSDSAVKLCADGGGL